MDLKERIARLDYMWRFCGVPDDYKAEWGKEISLAIKQSCREFAHEILSLVREEIKKHQLTPQKRAAIRANCTGPQWGTGGQGPDGEPDFYVIDEEQAAKDIAREQIQSILKALGGD